MASIYRHIDLHNTFAALRYPNYRLWFYGQIVSMFGTWMQNTAQSFLVYELTSSSAYLGYVSFAYGIPSWMFMLLGGLVADRISRRTMLIVSQSMMLVLAFILAALTFLEVVQPWHIILLSFLLGVANAFDAPARMAIVPELVERQDLTNAIALNATMFNTATMLGPAIAGIVYAAFGPAWCFMLNGISFVAVIAALVLMRLDNAPHTPRSLSVLAELKEGLQYVRTQRMIQALIFTIGMMALFGMSFQTLMPAWAVEILHGDVKTNGWLRSAQGTGSLIGALVIASLGRFKFRGRLLSFGTLAFPSLLLVFMLVRSLPLSLLVLVGAGFASIMIMNLANSLVQGSVPDALRGRVMSIYTLVFFGMMPLGSFLIGWVAEKFSEPLAILLGAGVLLTYASLVWLFVPKMRALE